MQSQQPTRPLGPFSLGFGRARLKHLQFISGVRDFDEKNVARLQVIFKTEGCRRDDPEHSIPALISKADFDSTRSAGADYGEMNLQPGQTLLCLHGKHRALAARAVLPVRDQWWTLALYDDGKSAGDRVEIQC